MPSSRVEEQVAVVAEQLIRKQQRLQKVEWKYL